MGAAAGVPVENKGAVTLSGFSGYNSRLNGLYTPDSDSVNGKPVYTHAVNEGVGAGCDWCRMWYAHGAWRIGHVHWVHGDNSLAVAYCKCTATFPNDIDPSTAWMEHTGQGSGKDYGKDERQFKKSGGKVVASNKGGSSTKRHDEKAPAKKYGAKLYHQTNPQAAESILSTQRMKPGTGGLAGAGIYFATTKEATAHKARGHGVILEAYVSLGKILTLEAEGDRLMTPEKLKGMHFDSVCIARKVSSGHEYVVYDPERVLFIEKA